MPNNGLATRWPAQAIAATGRAHGTVGTILASVADPQLLPLISNALGQGRDGGKGTPWATAQVVHVMVPDQQANAAGLACGGSARVLVQPTTDVPDIAWRVLADREPICLVTDLSGADVGPCRPAAAGRITSPPATQVTSERIVGVPDSRRAIFC